MIEDFPCDVYQLSRNEKIRLENKETNRKLRFHIKTCHEDDKN